MANARLREQQAATWNTSTRPSDGRCLADAPQFCTIRRAVHLSPPLIWEARPPASELRVLSHIEELVAASSAITIGRDLYVIIAQGLMIASESKSVGPMAAKTWQARVAAQHQLLLH